MKATCKLCEVELDSPIVGNLEVKTIAMGEVALNHMAIHHQEFVKNLVELNQQFNGFVVMNQFEFDDESMEEQKEELRDELVEVIMEDDPEDEENSETNEPLESDPSYGDVIDISVVENKTGG